MLSNEQIFKIAQSYLEDMNLKWNNSHYFLQKAIYKKPKKRIVAFIDRVIMKITSRSMFPYMEPDGYKVIKRKEEATRLVFFKKVEFEFVWIFYWQSEEALKGNNLKTLLNPPPLLVDKSDGKIYETPISRAIAIDIVLKDYMLYKEGKQHEILWNERLRN